jgi:hypothetical protein
MVLSGLFRLYELVQARTSLYKLKKVLCKFTDVSHSSFSSEDFVFMAHKTRCDPLRRGAPRPLRGLDERHEYDSHAVSMHLLEPTQITRLGRTLHTLSPQIEFWPCAPALALPVVLMRLERRKEGE